MLEIKDLYKKYNLQAGFFAPVGKFVYAVNGVSFTIRKNEIYGMVGESGCGKTTTARLLVRMFDPDSGEINFTDSRGTFYPVHTLPQAKLKEVRSKIQYVFQDPARSLNPRMNVLENLTAGYRYSPYWPGKKKAREQAASIMNDVGLSKGDLDRRPTDFSGGQRQRISIARALMAKPELLICDEVVSALDVSIQGQILNLLLKLREEYSLSMLFIAHDLAVVSFISDRVGVMYRGKIMEEAPSLRLVTQKIHPYTRHLYSSVPQLKRKLTAATQTRRYGSLPDPTSPPDFEPFDPLKAAGSLKAEKTDIPDMVCFENEHSVFKGM